MSYSFINFIVIHTSGLFTSVYFTAIKIIPKINRVL